MKNQNNIYSALLFLLLISVTSCRKASTELIEKTAIKEVGTEIIDKITRNSIEELASLGLSKEGKKFIIKNFDDDLTKQFLKIASENKTFLNTIKRNPRFLETWKVFAETSFGSNPKQLSWITRELSNDKYTFKKVGQTVEILDSKTNKLLGTFKNKEFEAIASKGGKKLNSILNIHPLIPNTHYKVGEISTFSDKFGRVEKMTCPLLSTENKVLRNAQEQGLSKKLKDGRIVVDELGNPIKVKAGYYRYSDDGGHLLANIFGGISEQINVLPMTNKANKIDFKAIENKLSKAFSQGKKITDFTVSPKYIGKSFRPDKFKVSYYIDGEYFSKTISNL